MQFFGREKMGLVTSDLSQLTLCAKALIARMRGDSLLKDEGPAAAAAVAGAEVGFSDVLGMEIVAVVDVVVVAAVVEEVAAVVVVAVVVVDVVVVVEASPFVLDAAAAAAAAAKRASVLFSPKTG